MSRIHFVRLIVLVLTATLAVGVSIAGVVYAMRGAEKPTYSPHPNNTPEQTVGPTLLSPSNSNEVPTIESEDSFKIR